MRVAAQDKLWRFIQISGVLMCAAIWFAIGMANAADQGDYSDSPKIVVPQVDSKRGRKLFVDKACVVCHSINGAGGKAAPELDAEADEQYIDLMEFTARMWRGADMMIVLQSMELGYKIDLNGQEIADLAAFVSDPEEQKDFTEDEIPELINEWLLDEPVDFDAQDFLNP